MTAEPRDVAAPTDALAWVFPSRGLPGYWATTTAQIKEAHRRGDPMLPTETDRRGYRWIRNITEYAHLADHLTLARDVHHLATAVDRLRTELEEADVDDTPTDHAERSGDDGTRHQHGTPPTHAGNHTADTPPSPRESRTQAPPDPDDVLMALMGIFERGSRQYRDADTTLPGFRELWNRLDGDEKELLQTYEAAANRNTDLWGDDRFRLGYALGASGILRRLA